MSNIPEDNTEDFHSLDFDEKIEIEKLQATIRSMSNFTDDSEGFLSQSPKVLMDGGFFDIPSDEFDPYAALEKPVERTAPVKAKKFVVMVNPENIEYFDKIAIDERSKLFNNLLTKYREDVTIAKKKKIVLKLTKHSLLGLFVIMLSLPIMFIIINKSIELTVKNYKDVQNNFEKLYESRNHGRFNAVRRNIY